MASVDWAVLAAKPTSPASRGHPALQGPPSWKRKANYITQQASRRPLSFQVFARGRRGGRGLDVTLLHSLSLCQIRDHFFFLPLLPPPYPPLPPCFPSLPPSPLCWVCALGRPIPSAAGTLRTRGRSQLSGASSLPSPSLPPSPTPDSGLARRPEEPRGEHLLSRPPLIVTSAC